MTGQKMLEELQAMPPEWLRQELIGMCSSSGVSYSACSIQPREIGHSRNCEGGPVCDMQQGDQYLEITLD